MIKVKVHPLLNKNFFPFNQKEERAIGIEMPSKIELLAKAAFWQGYSILDGFVPVRNISQTRLANPNKSKFRFLNLFLLHSSSLVL